MFINLYIAGPTYRFILIYTCGLTAVIKRRCYVMLCYSVKSNSSTVTLLTQYVAGSMWRYGVRPSVSLSVPSFGRRTPLRQVAAVGPAGTQEISIDSGGCRAPKQHGTQQQMRAVSRCQLTQEAEHRFVYLGFEVGVWLLRSEFALGVRVCGSDYDRDRYPRGRQTSYIRCYSAVISTTSSRASVVACGRFAGQRIARPVVGLRVVHCSQCSPRFRRDLSCPAFMHVPTSPAVRGVSSLPSNK